MTSPERGPSSRPALSRCIRISAEEFADRHWGREPLLSTADELAHGLRDLLADDSRRTQMGKAAAALVERNLGASGRYAQAIAELAVVAQETKAKRLKNRAET